jgi:EAL domain-containing protein (putative c-di-GMP-specific phosphodiesterase class I)
LQRAVIVEGVESEADAARLNEMGCEFAQGYLFAQALAPRDALTFIAKCFRAG